MVYLDNAATSWPKPESVYEAVDHCMRHAGANPGRSGHAMAVEAGRIVFETRRQLAALIGAGVERITFGHNATDAINLALKGILKPRDHVITSTFEHNAMARPLEALKACGLQVEKVTGSVDGGVDPKDIKAAICSNTKLIALTHASNVFGTLNDIGEIGRVAKDAGIPLMVDAAQTAGCVPIDVKAMNVSLLAMAGHKSLLGPQGTGALYIEEGLDLVPQKQGGTGSESHSLVQPMGMPERYESGTLNTPGLAGLGAGVRFIAHTGIGVIAKREHVLVQQLLEGLDGIENVVCYGPKKGRQRAAAVSFCIVGHDPQTVAMILDDHFDIAVRAGLHCAPDAHDFIGTKQAGGTVRISPGYFNTEAEIDAALRAVAQIAKG